MCDLTPLVEVTSSLEAPPLTYRRHCFCFWISVFSLIPLDTCRAVPFLSRLCAPWPAFRHSPPRLCAFTSGGGVWKQTEESMLTSWLCHLIVASTSMRLINKATKTRVLICEMGHCILGHKASIRITCINKCMRLFRAFSKWQW